MPLLMLQHGSDAGASADRAHPASALAARSPTTTTPTTHPPAPSLPPVAIAAAPVRNVVPTTTTTVPATTTTMVPATTTTTTAPPAAGAGAHVRTSGQVTYYDHPAGRCASPWLPFGTFVRVTNPATGATITCVVDDREADTARSIDLATSTFAEIAPLSQGVVDAQLIW